MLNLHVVLAVDRAGLVGEDGETHHGLFDIGFLRQAPNMQILCPVSMHELRDMLEWAVEVHDGPVAIRYPRGGDRSYTSSDWLVNQENTGLKCHRAGNDVTLITYGTILENVVEAAEELAHAGIHATVLRLTKVAPLPTDQILDLLGASSHVVVIEEICNGSGIREALAWELSHKRPDCCVDGIDLGHNFVTHGDIKSLYQNHGLDSKSISEFVMEVLRDEN